MGLSSKLPGRHDYIRTLISEKKIFLEYNFHFYRIYWVDVVYNEKKCADSLKHKEVIEAYIENRENKPYIGKVDGTRIPGKTGGFTNPQKGV